GSAALCPRLAAGARRRVARVGGWRGHAPPPGSAPRGGGRMIVFGSLLLLRLVSPFGFNDALVWPVVIAAMGLYVIWRQADQDDRAALTRVTSRLPTGERAGMRRPGAVARVLGGAGLVALGVGLFLATHN